MARGSKTDRPIMVLLDVLGRRWALRVLWELRAAELGFRGLQEACGGISPSVLAARVKELGELGVVELGDAGYRLTADGRALGALLVPLDRWARRSAKSR
jgi:DNA-binding HxlR family transcriptional regulator